MWVQGRVSSLPRREPDYLQFLFQPSPRQSALAGVPRNIQVRWYREPPAVEAGDTWRLKLRLRPPRGLANFQGHDREQALFAAGIGALASVQDGERMAHRDASLPSLHAWRAMLGERIREALPPGPPRALVLSLAIADRGELARAQWAQLRVTGTGHLLAISGLHIGLAAVAGFWLVRGLMFLLLPRAGGRAAIVACCIGAMALALAYGALAGFPVSTVRALVMLTVALALVAGRRACGVFGALSAAALAVLAIDPFAPLAAGFWLSFMAVLALLACFTPRTDRASWWASLPRAQVAVMVVMLPLAAFWFQAGSWLALPANLVAIPWVSLVTVPLILAGIATQPLAGISGSLLELAWWSCAALHEFLGRVAALEFGPGWLTPRVGPATAAVGLAGGLLLLLPRGMAARWLGVCLVAVVILPRAGDLSRGEYSVEILDVGQGLAVLVRTRDHTLLYDTGPGGGGDTDLRWSLFDPVVLPALAASGNPRPDRVVVSHADLDHAGGLADLRARFPGVDLRVNDREASSCHAGQSWAWDGVDFRVLHPTAWLPYLGNDSSCVLEIDNGQQRTLLSGDIGSAVEQRLAGSMGPFSLVTVPHHGSASSSGTPFLAAASPRWAVASAAHANRFGFPRAEVVERYRRTGAEFLSTIDCGALRAVFRQSGAPEWQAARQARDAPWRWQASHPCVVTSDPAMYHLERPDSRR